MKPLDTSRYRLDAPVASKQNDYGAWRSAVDNANAQLEHQYLRILNLDLLLKYGDKVRMWARTKHELGFPTSVNHETGICIQHACAIAGVLFR